MGAAGSLNEQQTDFLEIVKNNTERLAILVNDLLDISRIEAKKLNLSMQPLDILQIAEQAIADLEERSQKDDKNMNIVVDRPTSLPRVIGDAERVRQILDNLLENAYLYTAEGGDITLRMCPNEHDIQIDVQDNGIGIPIDIQERVFERFFRGEHAFVLASAGTGLGLSIVQHLVELHKGAIWLTSAGEPGEGSTFSFTLPIYTPKNG
jgi:two-component system phosphate regulon sensor histidine kinase PhoR